MMDERARISCFQREPSVRWRTLGFPRDGLDGLPQHIGKQQVEDSDGGQYHRAFTNSWQPFLLAEDAPAPPFADRYPARLPDGRVLFLPIRPLADTGNAIASLILTQCSFEVETTIAEVLAERLASSAPDIVVGLPTLGLPLARLVAERLGHTRYVALGTSPKFWYDEALSVPLASITSPTAKKCLFLDPRMLPLLKDAKVCLIDDVISSGKSILAALDLLQKVDVASVSVGTAMLQTRRWFKTLSMSRGEDLPKIVAAFETPLLTHSGSGWRIADEAEQAQPVKKRPRSISRALAPSTRMATFTSCGPGPSAPASGYLVRSTPRLLRSHTEKLGRSARSITHGS